MKNYAFCDDIVSISTSVIPYASLDDHSNTFPYLLPPFFFFTTQLNSSSTPPPPFPFLAWKCDISFPFQMIARINASKGKGERLFPYLLKIPDAGPPEKSRGMRAPTPPPSPTLADITHKEKNGSSRKIFRKLREPRKIHSPFSPGEREIPFPFVLPPTFKLPQG